MRSGDGVAGFAPGDRVIGLRDRLTAPGGAQAEFVALDADAVAHAPRTATAAEASTLPLNGLTAVQSLDLLALAPGEWLLVTGAAGAVGGFAVELAVLRGLRVVAVARRADEALVRGFGAELFVPATDELGSASGPSCRVASRRARRRRDRRGRARRRARRRGVRRRRGGRAPAFPLRGTRIDQVWIRADGARLGELAALVDAGRLTLRVAGRIRWPRSPRPRSGSRPAACAAASCSRSAEPQPACVAASLPTGGSALHANVIQRSVRRQT